MNHIVLIGFMGCGKSSVGRRLARKMNLRFVDMDHWIEERSGMTITEIFDRHGEAYFRRLETETLRELQAETQRMVISAGGGTAVQKVNQPILKAMGTVVLLETSKETLMERLKHDTSRPILQGGDLAQKIETLQRERKAAYEKVCDKKIVTDGKEFPAILQEIEEIVSEGKN